MRPTAVARVWGRSSTTSTTGDSFVNANAPEHDKPAEAAGPRRDAPPGPPRGEARPRPSFFGTTLPVSTKRGGARARKHALVKRRATGIVSQLETWLGSSAFTRPVADFRAGHRGRLKASMCGPGMRWCGLILNETGSLVQASQIAWNGVRHCIRFGRFAQLQAVTKARTWAFGLARVSSGKPLVEALGGSP